MTTPKEAEHAACASTALDLPEPLFQHAFMTALFEKPWAAEQHIKALYGWLMRAHAEAAHPGDVDKIAELSTAGMATLDREAWLFGYRFRDRPAASGGEGVGNQGSSGS